MPVWNKDVKCKYMYISYVKVYLPIKRNGVFSGWSTALRITQLFPGNIISRGLIWCCLISLRIPITKIRPYYDCVIFIMGIPTPGKTVFKMRVHWSYCSLVLSQWNGMDLLNHSYTVEPPDNTVIITWFQLPSINDKELDKILFKQIGIYSNEFYSKWNLDHYCNFQCLTLNMQGPSYLGLTVPLSWLLMTWLLASPGHQQPWYWLPKLGSSLSSMRKVFNYLCHVNVEEWHKM